jgi:ribosomal protein S12 methylthiotransferase accessory factor
MYQWGNPSLFAVQPRERELPMTSNSYPLLLQGEGDLFTALVTEFREQAVHTEVVHSIEAMGESERFTLLSVYDDYNPERELALQRTLRKKQGVWLPVWADFSTLWAGPWIVPNEPGCFQCTEERKHRYVKHPEYSTAERRIVQSLQAKSACQTVVTMACIRLFASLVKEDLALLRAGETPKLYRHVLHWKPFSFELQLHPVLPVPGCTICNPLPEDCPELAVIDLQKRTKAYPGSWRIRTKPDMIERIVYEGVSPITGLIQHLEERRGNMVLVHAPLPVPGTQTVHLEYGFGRATTAQHAKRIAVLEALERYAGFMPSGKRPTLRATYRELGKQALNPQRLGLFSQEQYNQPDFPLQPFDEEKTYLWVWAYSFGQGRPLAIPEEFAYYGTRLSRGRVHERESMLIYDLSNGCALGNCREEAILHALFELLERDAFLLTWYARLQPKRLNLASAQDFRIHELTEQIRAKGYEPWVFNTTREFGIPTVWAMAVSSCQKPERLNTVSAAGCHINPEQALFTALAEVSGMIDYGQAAYSVEREKALTLLTHSEQVEKMHDHMLLYALPEAFDRLQFLFEQAEPAVEISEAFPDYYTRTPTDNLTQDLQQCIDSILAQDLDVLVFDQTTQEQQHWGVNTVRVLIPGILPMMFGYQYRRITGCKRLERALGLQGEVSSTDLNKHINPWPHPFP